MREHYMMDPLEKPPPENGILSEKSAFTFTTSAGLL